MFKVKFLDKIVPTTVQYDCSKICEDLFHHHEHCPSIPQDQLKLEFSAVKDEVNKTWSGTAHVPIEYFPPGVNKINAYAIHGSGHARQYEALYPASKDFSMPDL